MPTSGDNYDDDDDPDCLEGASWKDGVRLLFLEPASERAQADPPRAPLPFLPPSQRCQVSPPSGKTCNLSTHYWWAGGARCGKVTTDRCVPRTTPSKAVTPPSDEPAACCPNNWHFVSLCVPVPTPGAARGMAVC